MLDTDRGCCYKYEGGNGMTTTSDEMIYICMSYCSELCFLPGLDSNPRHQGGLTNAGTTAAHSININIKGCSQYQWAFTAVVTADSSSSFSPLTAEI